MARKKNLDSTAPATPIADQVVQPTVSKRARTLVFISHDSRDSDLAEAFANLLSDVSAGTLKSFRSTEKKVSSGIEFGTEWYKAIMSQLGDATDVVALLTKRSIDRPWILYEAGVAKGKLDTNVLGVALGVPLEKVSTGPFGQFQNCGDDEDSLTKLVVQLLQRNPDASPRAEAVRMQVKVFLDNAKKILATKGEPTTSSASDDSSVAKLFEEVKAMVRELPERVDERVRTVAKRGSLSKFKHFHPLMFEEMLFHPALKVTGKNPALAWLLFISVLRDDFPWIYEVGFELYRALKKGDHLAILEAKQEMDAILEATTRGPLSKLLRPEDEEVFFMVRHLPDIVEHFLERSTKRRKTFVNRNNCEDISEKDNV